MSVRSRSSASWGLVCFSNALFLQAAALHLEVRALLGIWLSCLLVPRRKLQSNGPEKKNNEVENWVAQLLFYNGNWWMGKRGQGSLCWYWGGWRGNGTELYCQLGNWVFEAASSEHLLPYRYDQQLYRDDESFCIAFFNRFCIDVLVCLCDKMIVAMSLDELGATMRPLDASSSSCTKSCRKLCLQALHCFCLLVWSIASWNVFASTWLYQRGRRILWFMSNAISRMPDVVDLSAWDTQPGLWNWYVMIGLTLSNLMLKKKWDAEENGKIVSRSSSNIKPTSKDYFEWKLHFHGFNSCLYIDMMIWVGIGGTSCLQDYFEGHEVMSMYIAYGYTLGWYIVRSYLHSPVTTTNKVHFSKDYNLKTSLTDINTAINTKYFNIQVACRSLSLSGKT